MTRLQAVALALFAGVAVPRPADAQQADSAFHAMQHRGMKIMGVDQYASFHRFESLEDGGRIVFEASPADTVARDIIRQHLQGIAQAFRAGDFRDPHAVHATVVPGTKVMADRRERIEYRYRERPRGGEIRIVTTDSAALRAVHEFLAFQRLDHRAD